MNTLYYKNKTLHMDQVSLKTLADQWGTPAYLYSRHALEQQWLSFDTAFQNHPHQICYAVKANSNLSILRCLQQLGSGFDIVSQGELARVLAAGGDSKAIIFSGVGKTATEMEYALNIGIAAFHVESIPELKRLNAVASKLGKKAPVSLRINPNIDAETHPYITTGHQDNKFGIASKTALTAYQYAQTLPHITILGIACHIGSQLLSLTPYETMIKQLLILLDDLESVGIHLQRIDVGGGFGVCYRDEHPPTAEEFVRCLLKHLTNRPQTIIIEPGRAIVANAGVLLTRVEYLKETPQRNFAIVDAAMNDLLRPALYNAWQTILPITQREGPEKTYDVVGPVCESSDFLGKERSLAIEQGDLLAITGAGAYGFSMSSNYNSRPRAAEILIENEHARLIRPRETIDDLIHSELGMF